MYRPALGVIVASYPGLPMFFNVSHEKSFFCMKR